MILTITQFCYINFDDIVKRYYSAYIELESGKRTCMVMPFYKNHDLVSYLSNVGTGNCPSVSCNITTNMTMFKNERF